jgi:hypothetical protein
MKQTVLILLLLSLNTATYAQKRTTIAGDAWVGIVVTANETTREITLRHPDQSKNETFVGILEEGYKVRLKDGSWRFLQMSEIEPGSRIRVFYKSKTRDVGSQKVKALVIHRLDFLGIDQYTLLREALNLPALTPIAVNDGTKVPAANPLRLYLSIQQPSLHKRLTDWVAEWNEREGAKHRRIEIVSEFANSDVSIVSFWGRDELVAIAPAMVSDGYGELRDFFPASIYLVTKAQDALKVIWETGFMMPREKFEGQLRFEKEIEKMIKAKTK